MRGFQRPDAEECSDHGRLDAERDRNGRALPRRCSGHNVIVAGSRRRLTRRGIGVAALAAVAAIAVPMAASTAPANASTGFTVRISPDNTAGLMLDIDGASTSDAAELIDWVYNGGSNQVFTLEPSGNYYQIVNQNSGLCLFADGSPATSSTRNPATARPPSNGRLALTLNSGLAYTIQNPASGLTWT